MKKATRNSNPFGIALMLTLGLGIAGCGQPTAPAELVFDANKPVSSMTGQPNGNLKPNNLGNPVQGSWVGKWSTGSAGVTSGTIGLDGTGSIKDASTSTNIQYSFLNGNKDVIVRQGQFGNSLTTAYLVRKTAGADVFQGWYANYTPCSTGGCSGAFGYYELSRTTRSDNLAGAWTQTYENKFISNMAGGTLGFSSTRPGVPNVSYYATQQGTNLEYLINEGKDIRRSGTRPVGNADMASTAQLLAIPGNNHYLGWYADGSTGKLGLFVMAKGANAWGTAFERLDSPQTEGTVWDTDVNGKPAGSTNVQYTVNAQKDMYRTGLPAQLLNTNVGTDSYMGWYALNGTLGYFDMNKTAGTTMRGVNLAGLEFGPNAVSYANMPRNYQELANRAVNQYTTPLVSDIDAYMARGVNSFRIPFRWERLQFAPSEGTDSEGAKKVRSFPINEAYFNELNTLVQHATGKGASVILDMHNYGHYIRYMKNAPSQGEDPNKPFRGFNLIGASDVTAEDFAAIWSELARRYRGNALVKFGLMNEPLYEQTNLLVGVYQTAIKAIRAQGFQNEILVNGNYYSGAWSWNIPNFTIPQPNKYFGNESQYYDSTNKQRVIGTNQALSGLSDPVNKLVFEAHQYFDKDYSGSAPMGSARACDASASTADLFQPFTQFLRSNGKRGFIGEFGAWANGANCDTRLAEALTVLNNDKMYAGWTYWANGTNANDKMTITPNNSQMNVIQNYLR
jgi:endoglucanase